MIHSDDLDNAEAVFDAIFKGFGDYAPKKRRLVIDFKDGNGTDLNRELLTMQPIGTTLKQLIDSIRLEISATGGKLMGVTELTNAPRLIYIAPGYLEETMTEMGFQIPTDVEAAVKSDPTFQPVNLDELIREWSKK